MLGLEMAGFHTLLASEVHKDPCKTLSANFPNTPIVNGDVRDLTISDIKTLLGNKKSLNVDLLAGGPPCQGFSTAGLKDPDDPRNTLVGEFIRLVREIKPRAFIMENVPGLVSLHGGKLFNRILEEFDSTGYNIKYKVMKVADYGVPQMRRRLVVFGVKSGHVPDFPIATHGDLSTNNQGNLFDIDVLPYVTCGDALSDLPMIAQGEIATEYRKQPKSDYQKRMREGSTQIFNHEASRHKPETMAYYALIPRNGTALDIPIHLRKKKEGIQRWPLKGLSRAITTEPTDFLHPTLDRIPTVRELARIQSFPDTYVFLGQRTTGNKMRRLGYCSQTQQVGNAVPPLFAMALGEAIKKGL